MYLTGIRIGALALIAVSTFAGGLRVLATASGPQAALSVGPAPGDIHKIKHVVVILQENRSFDSYFGTFPGADGIPMDSNGVPTVCVPNPASGTCDKPYHNSSLINQGGPHGLGPSKSDIDGGKMDGFIKEAETLPHSTSPDVMGYHDFNEIPNYWTYASNFALQDHMFEPVGSWSEPAHLYAVSAWSAKCTNSLDPMSCSTNDVTPDCDGSTTCNPIENTHVPSDGDDGEPAASPPDYAWTDLSYLLHKNGVSWRYYRDRGDPSVPNSATPEIWNPEVDFTTVHSNRQLGDVPDLAQFRRDAADGTLPQVAWVAPNLANSEHPPQNISVGTQYVTGLVNNLMQGPDWGSTAIFLTWDDWGGFYDGVVPPKVDSAGYGIRVPALLVSPYAKQGFIDHQTLSFDAYLKFIEDDFMMGQRLDPATDGRPDPRPDVRENAAILGDLTKDFDFNQVPLPPLVLSPINRTWMQPTVPTPQQTASSSTSITVTAPGSVSFDGSQSTDPSAQLTSWSLRFGDGTPGATGSGSPPSSVVHTYTGAGSFSADLTVTDSIGAQSSTADTVIVNPASPLASVDAFPAWGAASLAVTFDGSVSSDQDDPIASWTMAFGDGSSAASGTGVPPSSIQHTYSLQGSYVATLTVTDASGLSAGAVALITVFPPPSPPSVQTSYPSAVTSNSAIVRAIVNPNGLTTTVYFDYGMSTSYGLRSGSQTLAASGTSTPLKELLNALTPGTIYHYRAVASNSLGTSYGNDKTFTTSPSAPTAAPTSILPQAE
jgi:phospholipase C